MASCLMHRYRGLAVLVRSYRSVFTLRQRGVSGQLPQAHANIGTAHIYCASSCG